MDKGILESRLLQYLHIRVYKSQIIINSYLSVSIKSVNNKKTQKKCHICNTLLFTGNCHTGIRGKIDWKTANYPHIYKNIDIDE